MKIKIANLSFLAFIYLLGGIYIVNISSSQPFSMLLDPYIFEFFKYILPNKQDNVLYKYILELDKSFLYLWVSIPIFFLILYLTIFSKLIFKHISSSEDHKLNPYEHNSFILIAIAAGLSLFIELVIIRLHSSYFQIFAFHKNFSLLSCLFGLGIGYIFGGRPLINLKYCFPLFSLQISFMFLLRYTPIGPFLQNPISEQFAMGQGFAQGFFQLSAIYIFIITIFLFNALCFIPLGHLISNLMLTENKLNAYSFNLIGSIGGVILFSIISYIWAPPIVWIIICFTVYLIFIPKNINSLLFPVLSFILVIILLSTPHRLNKFDIYSPYQIITLDLSNKSLLIKTSNLFFQRIHDYRNINKNVYDPTYERYNLPYKFNKQLNNVMIVGSGTGNDVAAALRNNAKNIDAVEIDPVINKIGEIYHPESPFQSSNVSTEIADARSFIRDTDKQYDLIVYGLLDSHTMLSGLSGGIRLDSYVYTVEAFREARSKLSKNGLISLSFSVLSKELGTKIYFMLKEAFDGIEPIVFSITNNNISFNETEYTYVIGDNIKYNNEYKNHLNVSNLFSDNSISVDLSTDDWPFFYMPHKTYPISYLVIIVLIFIISVIYMNYLIPLNYANISITSFFLGAGFMLLETKGITELALAFGSTWFVTAIVIIGILIMAFIANMFVIKFQPDIKYIYGLLIISIILSLLTKYIDFSVYPSIIIKIIFPIILTFPIFFSGLAFSSELNHISLVTALSSNILGAMFGGLLEYNTMYFGYKSLYLIIIIMYLIAFWCSSKRNFKI